MGEINNKTQPKKQSLGNEKINQRETSDHEFDDIKKWTEQAIEKIPYNQQSLNHLKNIIFDPDETLTQTLQINLYSYKKTFKEIAVANLTLGFTTWIGVAFYMVLIGICLLGVSAICGTMTGSVEAVLGMIGIFSIPLVVGMVLLLLFLIIVAPISAIVNLLIKAGLVKLYLKICGVSSSFKQITHLTGMNYAAITWIMIPLILLYFIPIVNYIVLVFLGLVLLYNIYLDYKAIMKTNNLSWIKNATVVSLAYFTPIIIGLGIGILYYLFVFLVSFGITLF